MNPCRIVAWTNGGSNEQTLLAVHAGYGVKLVQYGRRLADSVFLLSTLAPCRPGGLPDLSQCLVAEHVVGRFPAQFAAGHGVNPDAEVRSARGTPVGFMDGLWLAAHPASFDCDLAISRRSAYSGCHGRTKSASVRQPRGRELGTHGAHHRVCDPELLDAHPDSLATLGLYARPLVISGHIWPGTVRCRQCVARATGLLPAVALVGAGGGLSISPCLVAQYLGRSFRSCRTGLPGRGSIVLGPPLRS